VLPLENLSRDPEQDYFANGMTDDEKTAPTELIGCMLAGGWEGKMEILAKVLRSSLTGRARASPFSPANKGDNRMKHALLTAALVVLASPMAANAARVHPGAKAELKDAQGKTVGTARLTQLKKGVRISLSVRDLPAGTHAFHVHNVAQCEAPDFKSAGGHFNPEGKKHGMKNPDGPHAGDMPNITVAATGKGRALVLNTRVTLGDGANSLFHDGGTSIVIHEKADDDMTDPAGNAGNRIACGVIEKVQ
jgi:superoxide dismutase, Cu-Zn family